MHARIERFALLVVVVAAMAACGAAPREGGETVKVDVGEGQSIDLRTGPLKIGLFMSGMGNSWFQAFAADAQKQADEYGWELTVVDSNFDAQAQINALQNVATSRSYDAVAVVPVDAQQACTTLTKTLPAAGILVSSAATPLCGRYDRVGEEMWAPGTYSYSGVAGQYEFTKRWMEESATLFSGDQNVAVAVAPATYGTSVMVKNKIVPEIAQLHPDFKVKDLLYTDLSTPDAFRMVQTYLQANKETSVILSVTPDITRGVVQAIDSLGLNGKVKVGDEGGGQYSIDQIKNGSVSLTIPYWPGAEGTESIKAIKEAQDGGAPTRIRDEIPGGLASVPIVTRENVDTFTPTY